MFLEKENVEELHLCKL